ncbi:MAG: hypothetical protein A2X34_02530 [Elusimicrobia bacterium GWC2_51_8]|nr:MAG: hypothetical protein A2X33_00905 [Elusimicrobia bacterium GWA2_51_34]OGR60181.1 MAG: hypothetical protein A2X34_02530 [Elusimicrobia bacterium GWC2_51_8]OGR87373.1 MAG: hypothetical protein A2021_00890 [Elusimicrobia bacterium GWF2_52_66]HAF94812.1 hypothetical protein [Elusimicrobiota bacterium]HCE98878.1 hypothetical protein [Elusimicrobiota bacterium]
MIKKIRNVSLVVLPAVMFLLPSLTMGQPKPVAVAAPRPVAVDAATKYYFGSDWDVRYPKYSYMKNYEDFYITKIGAGTNSRDGSLPSTTLSGSPSSQYVYWFLCNNATNNGAVQADKFADTYRDHNTAVKNGYYKTFQGNTMFVDFERWEGSCADWGISKDAIVQNRKLFNSFLNRLHFREPKKKIGIYTGGIWKELLGSDYTFPARLKGKIVIWFAHYGNDCTYGGNKYHPAKWPTNKWQELRTGMGAVAESWQMFSDSSKYKVGGITPTIWQFCGDVGNITPKNPVKGF